LTIGYNENMYTKFDHKKKNYYTIQGNKENKIKHNNIVDYVQIRGVFRNFWNILKIIIIIIFLKKYQRTDYSNQHSICYILLRSNDPRNFEIHLESVHSLLYYYVLFYYNTFFKQLTIGYNENMYTKFDHKKKKYYTIQGNKENKIKHNNKNVSSNPLDFYHIIFCF
jgi:hypothetical protein